MYTIGKNDEAYLDGANLHFCFTAGSIYQLPNLACESHEIAFLGRVRCFRFTFSKSRVRNRVLGCATLRCESDVHWHDVLINVFL